MFEYKENDLMGPKSAFDNGQEQFLFCNAQGAADDQLAELSRLVGGSDEVPKSPLLKKPDPQKHTSIQLVDDAPALEFDLEGELSRAFEGQEEAVQSEPPAAQAPSIPAETSSDQNVELMDVDLLDEEFEKALADDLASSLELEAAEEIQKRGDVSPEPKPAPDTEAASVSPAKPAVADDKARRTLVTPTIAGGVTAASSVAVEPLAEVKTAPSNDFRDELARLLGQTPSEPTVEADIEPEPTAEAAVKDAVPLPPVPPAPPAPQEMVAPWDAPEIVEAATFPGEPEIQAESAPAPSIQPPQMSDYSDPAADLEDFLDRQSISSNDTTLEPASAVKETDASASSNPIDAAFDAVRLDAAVAGLAGAGAVMAAAAAKSTPAQVASPAHQEPVQAQPAIDPAAEFQAANQLDMEAFENELQIPDEHSSMEFEEKRGKGRKAAFAIMGLAVLGGVAVVGWNAMQGSDGPAPTIMASTDPVKVKPSDAGGKIVPNQDQAVYQSVDGADKDLPKQERLNDSSEQPIEVGAGVEPKTSDRIAATSGETTGGLILQPRRVRTVVVKPDGTIVSTSADAPAAGGVTVNEPVLALRPQTSGAATATLGTAPSQLRTVTYSAPRANDQSTAKAAEPVQVARVQPQPVKTQEPTQPAAAPVEEPKPEAPKLDSEGLPSTPSPFAVQVSSQRSAAAAKQTYATLSRRYASVIGGKGVDIRKAVIKGKGAYYRVRIPAETRSSANTMCKQLKSKGGDCFVTK